MEVWIWVLSTLLLGANIFCSRSMNRVPNTSSQNMHPDRCNQHYKFLVWNIQGAGSREALNVLREHNHLHKPSIVALLETRISGFRAQSICTKSGFRNSFRVEARGFQGGIWVLWNADEIDIAVLNSHEQFVTVEIKSQGQVDWLLTFIYASPQPQTREVLWQELQHRASEYQRPWLLAGDFNETASLEERNHGGADMWRRCQRFKAWIENNGLIDVGYSGPKFTWARGLSAATRKETRLDRALCNAAWRVKFQDGTVRHLQAGSNHSPLLIST